MSVRLNHGEVDLGEVHEINVAPFIDVILVLLIIFMIAACPFPTLRRSRPWTSPWIFRPPMHNASRGPTSRSI